MAAFEDGPERDGTIICLAPLSAIHSRILRPTPPKPPAMKYDASGSKLQSLVFVIYFWSLSVHESYLDMLVKLTGTSSFVSKSIIIRPVFSPLCIYRNAF